MRLLTIFLVPLSVLLLTRPSFSAPFEEFTFYNEISIGGGTLSQEASGAKVSGTAPLLGYRLGVRDHYVIGVVDFRALSFSPSSGSDEAMNYYIVGAGLGVEWDVPLRFLFTFDISMGDLSGGTTSLKSSTTMELSYFISESMTLGLQMQSGSVETTFQSVVSDVSMSGTFLVLSFPFDINYPEVSWRNRQD